MSSSSASSRPSLDDFNRTEHRLQLEGARTGRELPAVVDQVITYHWVDFGDGVPDARLCLHLAEPLAATRRRIDPAASSSSRSRISANFSSNLTKPRSGGFALSSQPLAKVKVKGSMTS